MTRFMPSLTGKGAVIAVDEAAKIPLEGWAMLEQAVDPIGALIARLEKLCDTLDMGVSRPDYWRVAAIIGDRETHEVEETLEDALRAALAWAEEQKE